MFYLFFANWKNLMEYGLKISFLVRLQDVALSFFATEIFCCEEWFQNFNPFHDNVPLWYHLQIFKILWCFWWGIERKYCLERITSVSCLINTKIEKNIFPNLVCRLLWFANFWNYDNNYWDIWLISLFGDTKVNKNQESESANQVGFICN